MIRQCPDTFYCARALSPSDYTKTVLFNSQTLMIMRDDKIDDKNQKRETGNSSENEGDLCCFEQAKNHALRINEP